jgi:hypothetical protein
MELSAEEEYAFVATYKWMYNEIRNTTMASPSNLDVLAAILVMENKDPLALVELMKEIKELDVND